MKKHLVISGILIAGVVVGSTLGPTALAAVSKNIAQFPEGERLIYSKILDAYRRNQLADVIRQRQVLERNYPYSVHLDHAYYLTGMAQYQNNRLGEALQAFDVVKDRFVKSNKRPAALFAMAMTYQRLNLQALAHQVLERLINEYPGSPESQRAWMQLKLEKEKTARKS